MSWAGTYVHSLAIALDMAAAAVFFNRNDVTVSSLCRIVQLADQGGSEWAWRLKTLKLAGWQVGLLRAIGGLLNSTFKNHCEAARVSDLLRAGSILRLLDDPTPWF